MAKLNSAVVTVFPPGVFITTVPWSVAAWISTLSTPTPARPTTRNFGADSITLRDMYKKHHWQVSGPTFYQLHLIFDKHFNEQNELVDQIGERIMLLGGVSIAMAADVAETTQIERPPRGREEVPVQLSRLLDAHQIIIRQTRTLARRATALGDDGTNDLLVSEVLRTNELQVWFLSEHLVDVPLVNAQKGTASGA